LKIDFTNTSDPNGLGNINDMKFLWDFGNGDTDTVSNPVDVSFPESRTQDSIFTIQLTVWASTGCPAAISDSVRVFPKPQIGFTRSDTAGCGPLTIHFNNTSSPNDTGSISIMRFVWDLGNDNKQTSANGTSVYPASKTKDSLYTIQLTGYTEHNCSDSLQQTILVFPKPLARYGVSTSEGCSPLMVNFSNTSIPYDTGSINDMRFNWSFGNGDSSQETQPADSFFELPLFDTTYLVELIAISEHGCLDTMYDSILVHPTPTVRFSPDTLSGCGPLSVRFTNQSVLNDSSFWSISNNFGLSSGDTNYTFAWKHLADTTYTVSLFSKSRYDCISDTISEDITVFAQPISDFSVTDDSICIEDQFEFTNHSQGAIAYAWDFGDGRIDSSFHNTHQYARGTDPFSGLNRDVWLRSISNRGCVDSSTRPVYVFPYTIADIGNNIDSFCSPLSVQFINASTNLVRSKWWFGTGDTSDLAAPLYFYQNISNVARRMEVHLETENQHGCLDRDTLVFKVLPEPIADFSPFRLDVCDSGYHTLVNVSINNAENEWDFGDGMTSLDQEPYHKFARNSNGWANYTIRLIVRNESGCPDTAFEQVSLNPFPTVDFDTTLNHGLCVEDVVNFTNRSTFTVFHKWSFGDGAESRDSQPSYFYPYAGLYDVKYVGYDVNGCPDSITKQGMIRVFDRPVADFIFTPGTPKMPYSEVQFTDQSTPTSGLTFDWDFDDPPGSSDNQHPIHAFSDSGWYNVRQIVDNGFCSDTITKPLYVSPPFPLADFSVSDTSGCGPLLVQFQQQSQDATSYRWFFDDGNESSLPNPTHTFTHEGYYDITLITYGPGGQHDTTFNQLIRVYPSPTAYFTISPTEKHLPNAAFGARNESSDASTYRWWLLNETGQTVHTSDEEHPIFTINNTGSFSVDLVAINTLGCSDTFQRPMYLTVLDSGQILIPSAFTPRTSDGVNDTYKPVMLSVNPEGYSFSIFNRWGERIFYTNNIDQAWDGTYQGAICETEVYLFLVEGQYYSGETFKESGTVLLLK
ncbi:MAG: PKD domain-containing protein, partial [Bacteroidia bacterium]|nr:PKD domain-containing protein [Bacteroidia bacterium]